MIITLRFCNEYEQHKTNIPNLKQSVLSWTADVQLYLGIKPKKQWITLDQNQQSLATIVKKNGITLLRQVWYDDISRTNTIPKYNTQCTIHLIVYNHRRYMIRRTTYILSGDTLNKWSSGLEPTKEIKSHNNALSSPISRDSKHNWQLLDR